MLFSERHVETGGGRVHAKITLADDDTIFITSANFTGHAMEKNLEAGVLIKGGETPQDISRHLKGLIDLNTITRVN
ncbi:phospholipase D-like domain-containing protein [Lutimaribacter pacificus]|uniref:phospholipase D-like domain-containing protein n=1 Tax=Lutimaribacter pacificus TaxID=391948 RepID=UPI001CB7E091